PNVFGLGWLCGYDGSAAPNNWKGYVRNGVHRNIISSTTFELYSNGGNRPKEEFMDANKVPDSLLETSESSTGFCTDKIISQPQELPPGWQVRKADDGQIRIHNADGVALPRVDNPLVGTPDQQEALADYNRWQLDSALERLKQSRKE